MDLPLFERASRRAFLRTSLTATALVATGGLLAACGDDDAKSLSSPATTAGGTATSAAAPTTSAAAASSDAPSTSASASTTTGGAATSAGGTTVSFTYTPSATGGRVRNPYVAVWVEDASERLVAVLNITYLAREAKYLRELSEFIAKATDLTTAQVDAVTGATRSAGQYTFTWDGKGLDGSVLSGAHTVWIEAAREHGPHSVTSAAVTLGAAATVTIPANGEISDATVSVG